MATTTRILHVLTGGGVGGTQRYVQSLCRYHDRSRFRVYVCVLMEGGTVSREIANMGVEVFVLNMSTGFDLPRVWRLFTLIRRLGIDIVNIHSQTPLAKVCCVLSNARRVIQTDHGTTVGSPTKRKRRVVFVNRLLTRYIDHFVAISKGMERSLATREHVPPSKMTLIYNGVDVDAVASLQVDREDYKRRLGLRPGTPVIGMVGRISFEKRYPLLLETLAVLKKQGVEFGGLIIGDGPQRQEIDALVDALSLRDRVILLGERADVHELLKIMDVFAFSSAGEAFSITVLEAMASQIPVVAFDVEGVNEAVVQNETGFLVPYGDVDALAGKLRLLLENRAIAESMGMAALKRTRERFELKNNIRELEKLYEKCPLGSP